MLRWMMAGLLLACGPRTVVSPEAGDTTGDAAETGAAESDATTDAAEGSSSGLWEICPCEEVPADWKFCEPKTFSAVEAPRVRTELSPMTDDVGSELVLHDGSLFVVDDESGVIDPPNLLRWSLGDEAFENVLTLESAEEDIDAIAASDIGVLMMIQKGFDPARLVRWTPEEGLVVVARFDGELDVGRLAADEMRNGAGRVQLGLHARDYFDVEQASADSRAVVDVVLSSGEYSLIGEPLAGFVPTNDGWWGRRAQLGEYQYCFDYSCIRDHVATRWDLLARSGEDVVAREGCVEGAFGAEIRDAWVEGSDYVFVTQVSARRIDASGREHELWRGGRIADAHLEGTALFLSLSHEVEDADNPGAGRNELVRVDLEGGSAERLLSADIDDNRQTFDLAGVIDGRLYFAAPLPDWKHRLESIDL